MSTWNYNPADYVEKDFAPIPVGEHRVRVEDAAFKTFKSGKSGYEITLAVSGHSGKLWHYLVLDHGDPQKTNSNLGSFFDSFGITDYDLDHYRNWVGKVGAVRVKHTDYNGNTSAKVHYCIAKKLQDKLPPAQFSGAAPTVIASSELPF